MATLVLTRGATWEDSGCSVMARVTGQDGEAITQASITAITCTVFQAGTSVGTPAVVVADSVFDTLQTDSRWTIDDTGYNFRHDVPAVSFATGDKIYRLEYKFDPAAGENFHIVFEIHARGLLTS